MHRTSSPVSRLHIRIESGELEIANLQSEVIATLFTYPKWPERVNISFPWVKSQTLRVVSSDPETAILPSELSATHFIQAECPERVNSSVPLARSCTLSVLSIE